MLWVRMLFLEMKRRSAIAGPVKPQNGGAVAAISVNSGVAIVAVIVAVAGILIIRFVFYGLFVGIAI